MHLLRARLRARCWRQERIRRGSLRSPSLEQPARCPRGHRPAWRRPQSGEDAATLRTGGRGVQEWGTGARSWCLNRSSAGSGARERRFMGAAGRSRGVQREGEGCRHVLPEHPWRGGRGRLEVEGGSGRVSGVRPECLRLRLLVWVGWPSSGLGKTAADRDQNGSE